MSRKVQVVGIDLKRRAPYHSHVIVALQRKRLKPDPNEGDYVLCLGSEAFQTATHLRLPLHDVRGELHHTHDGRLCAVTFHPRMIVKNRRLEKLFVQDLNGYADLFKFDLGGVL